MRRKKGTDANRRFLFGSVFFFFIIVIVIGLFSYFTLQYYWQGSGETKNVAKVARPQYDYSVAFDADFKETCEDESVIELETALEEYDGFR